MSTSPPAPRGALRIGSVARVPIYLDRTWLILAVFIAVTGYQSASGSLSADEYGRGFEVAYAAWLVVAIFVAVVGHEVGHAVVARVVGFRVHRIVATVWGGHTAYDGSTATPGRTAVVALSGPAVNGAFAALGGAASATFPGVAGTFAYSFAFLNGLLALFNLLPGLPLDGGAAVQSLVWGVTRRRDLGLLVAGWLGRVVAVGIVLWFLVLPFTRGERPDLMNLVVSLVMAWVLWSGASAAVRRAPVERIVDQVRVGEAAQPAVVLPRDTPVSVARDHPDLVVCLDEHERPTLVLLHSAAEDAASTTPVGAVVARIPDGNVVEAGPDDGLAPVLLAMSAGGTPVVVLTRGGVVWGVASAATVDAAARRVRSRS